MANITITTTGAEDQKISPAMGDYLKLGHNANAAEVKQAIIRWVKEITVNYWWRKDSGQFKTDYVPPVIDPQ